MAWEVGNLHVHQRSDLFWMEKANVRIGERDGTACDAQSEAQPHFLIHVLQGNLVKQPVATAETMDPSLWSNLPNDLLERTFCVLSVTDRVRFASLNKSWRDLLLSKYEFERMQKWLEAPPVVEPSPPICAVEFVPGRLARCRRRPSDIVCRAEAEGFEVRRQRIVAEIGYLPWDDCTVHQGLLCFYQHEPEDPISTVTDIYVANPLAKTWTCLPRILPEEGYRFNKHTLKKAQLESLEGGHFRFTVVSNDYSIEYAGVLASIYSSSTGSWRRVGLEEVYLGFWFPPLSHESDADLWPQYVVCQGNLYIATVRFKTVFSNYDDILIHVFNLESGALLQTQETQDAVRLIGDYTSIIAEHPWYMVTLMEYRGRVVSADSRPRMDGDGLEYGIWELNLDSLTWHKLSSIGKQTLTQANLEGQNVELHCLMADSYMHVLETAVLVGDNICLTLGVRDRTDTQTRTHLIAYNITTNSWSIVLSGLVSHHFNGPYHIFSPNFQNLGF